MTQRAQCLSALRTALAAIVGLEPRDRAGPYTHVLGAAAGGASRSVEDSHAEARAVLKLISKAAKVRFLLEFLEFMSATAEPRPNDCRDAPPHMSCDRGGPCSGSGARRARARAQHRNGST